MMQSTLENCTMDDLTLLRQCCREHNDADFEILIHRHAGTAYRLALSYLRNAADAEDAVQESFLNVVTNSERVCRNEQFNVRGWIMSIVIGNCLKKLRENRYAAQLAVNLQRERTDDLKSQPVESRELIAASLRSVDALPEHYRVPVMLHYIEGYSYKEVAETLSMREDAIRKQASRGIALIREALIAAGFSIETAAIPSLIALTPKPQPVELFAKILTASNVSQLKQPQFLRESYELKPSRRSLHKAIGVGVLLLLLSGVGVFALRPNTGVNRISQALKASNYNATSGAQITIASTAPEAQSVVPQKASTGTNVQTYANKGHDRTQSPDPSALSREIAKEKIDRSWDVPLTHDWHAIVIHHSLSTHGSAASLDQEHKQKGWTSLGYHFVIGNFDTGIPTQRQAASLRSLIRFLHEKTKIPSTQILGHHQCVGCDRSTTCPGNNLCLASFEPWFEDEKLSEATKVEDF